MVGLLALEGNPKFTAATGVVNADPDLGFHGKGKGAALGKRNRPRLWWASLAAGFWRKKDGCHGRKGLVLLEGLEGRIER